MHSKNAIFKHTYYYLLLAWNNFPNRMPNAKVDFRQKIFLEIKSFLACFITQVTLILLKTYSFDVFSCPNIPPTHTLVLHLIQIPPLLSASPPFAIIAAYIYIALYSLQKSIFVHIQTKITREVLILNSQTFKNFKIKT